MADAILEADLSVKTGRAAATREEDVKRVATLLSKGVADREALAQAIDGSDQAGTADGKSTRHLRSMSRLMRMAASSSESHGDTESGFAAFASVVTDEQSTAHAIDVSEREMQLSERGEVEIEATTTTRLLSLPNVAVDNNSAKRLVSHGFPPMAIKPLATASGAYIPPASKHAPCEVISKPFTPITVVSDALASVRRGETPKCLDLGSNYNTIWAQLPPTGQLLYASESDVATLIWLALNELIHVAQPLLPPNRRIEVFSEIEVSGCKPDLWFVKRHGYAVGIMEVKRPHNSGLNEPTVLGEVLDAAEMVSQIQQHDCFFALLTDYVGWRILWLDDGASSSVAASQELPASPTEGADFEPNFFGGLPAYSRQPAGTVPPELQLLGALPDRMGDSGVQQHEQHPANRSLFGTDVISYKDPSLVPLLLSLIIKMSYATPRPSYNLGAARHYCVLRKARMRN